jgi:hypothetical protein
MDTSELVMVLATFIFFAFVFPILIAMSPSIFSFYVVNKIYRESSVKSKKLAKYNVFVSLFLVILSYSSLLYHFMYVDAEINTPGFVLTMFVYLMVLFPLCITFPLSIYCIWLGKK